MVFKGVNFFWKHYLHRKLDYQMSESINCCYICEEAVAFNDLLVVVDSYFIKLSKCPGTNGHLWYVGARQVMCDIAG